jgi:hypothetical protein
MSKKRRVYQPRLVGDKVMMPADLKRLHKYMLEIETYQRHIGRGARSRRRGMAGACAQTAAEVAALT